MGPVKLSVLAILLGLGYALVHVYGVIRPAAFGAWARKLPRNTPIGYPLMLVATVWFVQNVRAEPIADFAAMKPYLCAFFAAVGVGACIFVKDFLPVRGVAVLLLLLGKLMVDSARWVDTPWRLVISTWAYVWVIAGMWFTISPWRMRDLIDWATANDQRTRLLSGLRVAFGLFVCILGFTAFRSAELGAGTRSQYPSVTQASTVESSQPAVRSPASGA